MTESCGTSWLTLLVCGMLAAACGDKTGADANDDKTAELPAKKSTASAEASATSSASSTPPPPASASAPPAGKGPMATIPAGSVLVGHACGAVPRVTDEELVNPSVALGEFLIDSYPYPNDPAQPPKTNVTRAEAEQLCEGQGKRLCSGIEWERACKGSSNATFEYGNAYDKKACETTGTLLPGQRAKCESGFAVKDMHGLAFEWTSSPWGRGQSGLFTVRGRRGLPDVVRERCASGQGREPMRGAADVGFRCCSGVANAEIVDLPISKQPVLNDDGRPLGDRITALLAAMPADHQKVNGATVSFDRVWRWHPRDNEELLLARWVGQRGRSGKFFELVVFKMCGTTPTRVQRLRGPVGSLESVRETAAKEKLSIEVATKKEKGTVELTYWYGAVGLKEPAWIKAGNQLDLGKDPDDKGDKKRIKIKVPRR